MNYKRLIFLSLGIIVFLASACLDDSGDTFNAAEQFGIDTIKIDNYLASKGIVAEIDSLSRIRYVIVEEGTGESPDDSDTLVVNYEGRLIPSETKFGEDDTVSLILNQMIAGWRIGLPLIKEEGTIRLFIPSYYGYGPYARGEDSIIPANSCLMFDVDLIEIK